MEKELHKRMQPKECIKHLNTIISQNILARISPALTEELTELQIKYEINYSNDSIIRWERSQIQQLIGVNGELQLTEKYIPEPFICFLTTDKDILEAIQSFKHLRLVQNIRESHIGCKVILLVYCPDESRIYRKFQSLIETSLTEIQIMEQCSHRILRGVIEFNRCVVQFTKSIAEIPYKKDKNAKLSSEYFLLNDNKDCVPVKGNAGLTRLFQQHLIRLSGVTLETAEAIIGHYPTPSQLIEAFLVEGPNLLAEIQVKRSATNSKTDRKVGPEVSKKLHTLYTSRDAEEYL